MRLLLSVALVTCLLFPNYLFSKSRLGLPKVLNYAKDDYKAGLMNWDITEGERGIMYFANNYGLVTYDGQEWNLVLEADNRTNLTALAKNYEERLFLGAYNEMGYMVDNGIGQVEYRSLIDLIPVDDREFGTVQRIACIEKDIYFFTSHKICILRDDKFQVIPASNEYIYFQKLKSKVYVQQTGQGVYSVTDNGFELMNGTEQLYDMTVKFMYIMDQSFHFVTENKGVFGIVDGQLVPMQTPMHEILSSSKVNVGKQLSDGRIAIGTVKDGLYIFENDGSLSIQINRDSGLKNNSITSIYEDDIQNLWLSLNNGISYVELGSDFYYVDDRNGLHGSVYGIEFTEDQLWLASNQGVYYSDYGQGPALNFNYVKNSDEQAWSVSEVDGEILVANHKGAFIADEDGFNPLHTSPNGAWQFIKPKGRDDVMLQGSYEGIYVFRKVAGQWKFTNELKGFPYTAREMTFDKYGNLWVGHGYNGIYKLKLDSRFEKITHTELYDASRGLPSNTWNNLFFLRGEIMVGTQFGVYQYNPLTDVMEPHEQYQQLLGDKQLIRRLVETPDGNLLFIKGLDNQEEIGIINESSGNDDILQTQSFHKLRGDLIPAFEPIAFIDDQIIFGAKEGIISYAANNKARSKTDFYTNITGVYLSHANDSMIYGRPDEFDAAFYGQEVIQRIPFKQNAVRVKYASAYFEKSQNILYRSILEGYDDDWTNWGEATFREFTNLKEGRYTFRVESKNAYNSIGAVDEFTFEILPPWYRTIWMYMFYVCIFIACLLVVFYIRKKQIYQINMQHDQRMTQLQMEKLKAEVDYKSRELASSTIHLAQQNETILSTMNTIEGIDTIKDKAAIVQLKEVVRNLKGMISEESNWDQFELHFNEIHNNFITRLKVKYAKLTSRDIRLCAYLRMNLSSKEIAPLMGISYRGVEALRYRVRKKLELNSQDNLTEFILGF